MTKYIYKEKEISHTKFLTICQMAGVMGGRKKSHYQKLVEMAEQGNEKAQTILNDLEVVEPYTMQDMADYIKAAETFYSQLNEFISAGTLPLADLAYPDHDGKADAYVVADMMQLRDLLNSIKAGCEVGVNHLSNIINP